MMRKWLLRLAALVGVAILCVAGFAAYVGYRIYFHGPGALDRMTVSAPAATYRYGAAPQDVADLRLPAGKGPFPIAVLVHGGCWDKSVGGARSNMAPLADALAKAGIATLNIEYRQLGDPGGGWPGTMRDVGTAIDGVRALARRYPIDPARLNVVGHSAGAQLALWSAIRGRLDPQSDLAMPDPLLPKAVVAVDGPGALAEFVGVDADICGKPVIVPFMGGTPRRFPQRYRDASPQDHLPLGVPQYLAQAALGDLMQPYVDRARRAGDPVETYHPPHGKHFDIINPEQVQGQATLAMIVRAANRTGTTAR